MAFCISCGAELTGDYCFRCGAPATGAPRRRGMNPVLKWVLISFGSLAGFMLLAAIFGPLIIRFAEETSVPSPPHNLTAERETVQTAMYAMMADKNITTVTPNDDTNNSLGENTWTGLPAGAGSASLDAYLKRTPTTFYYCWDSRGKVYPQNRTDGVRAEPDDAAIQRPCKKMPTR